MGGCPAIALPWKESVKRRPFGIPDPLRVQSLGGRRLGYLARCNGRACRREVGGDFASGFEGDELADDEVVDVGRSEITGSGKGENVWRSLACLAGMPSIHVREAPTNHRLQRTQISH